MCFLRSAGWMMGICTHENKANFRQVSYVIKQTFICSDRTKKNPKKTSARQPLNTSGMDTVTSI